MSLRKTIMVCDDEPDLLLMYRLALEGLYDVILADSGKQCLERYTAEIKAGNKIDALLLDYKLGDMLGDYVACEISKLDGTKTLLVTAYDLDPKMVSDLKQRGCIVDTNRKPVRIRAMLEQLESIL